ncbi:MAG: flippase-like domain-containing protein [Clostridiales bacterium]|nr:flippase-like domain-containing protein [Clostridiales bacterium]
MKKIGIFVLSVLLIVMFWQFDFASFIINIKKVPLLAFAGLLLIQIFSQLLVNYQWCRIGKVMGGEHSFFKILYVNARGMIIESITPGVKIGGEVTRGILLKNDLNYSTRDAATLVTIQKMVSLFSFFLVNLFAFAHISNRIDLFNGAILKVIIYLFIIVLIGILIAVFAFTASFEKRVSMIVPKRKWTVALQGYALTLLSSIKMLKSIKGEIYKQFLLSLSIWMLFPLKMILLTQLFTTNFDPVYLTEVTFISYMVGMIPLLPGGIGSFEATMTSLLVAMQIDHNEALAITLLFRFITFWFVIIISLLYVGIWKIGGKKDESH